jgi:hypothetical protein
MAGKMKRQQDGPLLLFDSTESFDRGMDGIHSRRKGTRDHLQKINDVQDIICQCAMGYEWYDTIDYGLRECGLH